MAEEAVKSAIAVESSSLADYKDKEADMSREIQRGNAMKPETQKETTSW